MSPKRPLAVFVLALVPFWPSSADPVRRVDPRPTPIVSRVVGRACTPAVATPTVRREAARCLMAGQGMWIYEFDRVEGGDPWKIVKRMQRMHISYVLIRAGSSRMGFYAQRHLDALLPVAHAAGLKVLVWDFPYLFAPRADAKRAAQELAYTTPGGHRPDGIVPDIEEPAQGVNLTRERAALYAKELRRRTGGRAVLIATTPRPTPTRVANYPYAELAPHFDGFAPMVYWGYEEPGGAVRRSIQRLAKYRLPVIPVGQSYDMRPEGGPGHPSASATRRFMLQAYRFGAPGVSFWSWQHATEFNWRIVRDFGRSNPLPLIP
jgi:hypothetical protein